MNKCIFKIKTHFITACFIQPTDKKKPKKKPKHKKYKNVHDSSGVMVLMYYSWTV